MKYDLLIIGSSTGGPKALYNIIDKFDRDLNIPILIVQHLPVSFENSFVEVLNNKSILTTKIAEDGITLEPNFIYVTKGGYQTEFQENLRIKVIENNTIGNFAPSISKTIISAIEARLKPIICILSGLSAKEDGLSGCKLAKLKNFPIIIQDKNSSLIYGMQKIIKEAGFFDYELDIFDIPKKIYEILQLS
ncbi:MAG: CheB methylesterase domain-containing protein [Spirochaetes bacterium]|nr:CheB methylesterase domain-containing protein [Spirochaetota bacterium]